VVIVSTNITRAYWLTQPILVAVRTKELVCGRSIAGIAGSNLAEGVVVRLLCVV